MMLETVRLTQVRKEKLLPDLFESVSKVVVSICEVGFELNSVVEGLDGVGEVSEVVVAAAQVAVSDGKVWFAAVKIITINFVARYFAQPNLA